MHKHIYINHDLKLVVTVITEKDEFDWSGIEETQ